jgi:hypothetical protein
MDTTEKRILEAEKIKRQAADAKFQGGRLWIKGGIPCPNTGKSYAADEWYQTMYSEDFIRSMYDLPPTK